jgi:uncharacterized protein
VTEPLAPGGSAVLGVPPGRYALGIAVTILAILSQYFVPALWPSTLVVYGSLAGDVAIVYGLPVVAFALLVGVGPLRRWNAAPATAAWEGLRWYGLLALLGLLIAVALVPLYQLVDPAALHLLSRPNPVLRAASGDPWFYVAFSFAAGAFEEAIFRGWFFGAWKSSGAGWVTPATWTSVVFAGLHLYYSTTYGAASLLIFPELFLLGFAFAATYQLSGGNLVVPSVLHGAYDASAFLTLVSTDAGLLLRYVPMLVGALVGAVHYLRTPAGAPGNLGASRPSAEAAPNAPGSAVTIKSGTPLPSAVPPGDDELRTILGRARTVAVVGLSDKPERDSNEVARYLQGQGYRVIPVNPQLSEVLGERAYPSVTAIPPETRLDIVDIFRRGDQVPPIVDEAIARGVPVVWMQLGVENPAAAARAREHGLVVLENSCIMQQHRRLGVPRAGPS